MPKRPRASAATSRDFRSKLVKRARKAGLDLPPEVVDGLESYFDLLRLWNRKIALTSLPIDEAGEEAIDRLLIEPVLAAKYLPAREATVIDIGSGGGSPAIPMKLAAPQISMRMVESKTRKAAFLREASRHLNLTSTEVETARFEQLLARPELHEAVDVVTLRAVRTERATLMGLQAFLKPGGMMFLFRSGANSDQEAPAPPPLIWRSTYPLVENLRSRLVILGKLHHAGQEASAQAAGSR